MTGLLRDCRAIDTRFQRPSIDELYRPDETRAIRPGFRFRQRLPVGWAKARSAVPTRASRNVRSETEKSTLPRLLRGGAARGHGAARLCPPYEARMRPFAGGFSGVGSPLTSTSAPAASASARPIITNNGPA